MKSIDWKNIAISSLIGGLVGMGISFYFSVESGKDLEKETARLRRLNQIMLSGMENAGWVKLSRDGAGEITGLIVELSGGQHGEGAQAGGIATPSLSHSNQPDSK